MGWVLERGGGLGVLGDWGNLGIGLGWTGENDNR